MKKLFGTIILSIFLSLSAQASAMWVSDLHISYGIDVQKGIAIDVTKTIDAHQKKFFVSGWFHNITPKREFSLKWYHHITKEKKELLSEYKFKIDGTRFLGSSLTIPDNMTLDEGEYSADFFSEDGLLGSASFRVVDTRKSSKSSKHGQCRTFDKKSEKEMFFRVKKRYPEITMDEIKKMKLGRYYDAKSGVGVVAPKVWKNITGKGDTILYLIEKEGDSSRKFVIKMVPSSWSNSEARIPEKIIKKISKFIAEASTEEAVKNGDTMKPIGSLKLLTIKSYRVGHFVLFRKGAKTRWESYSLIWNGKNLYILAVMSQEDKILLGEFLSSLGVESFCSEERK